tara:strand:- start:246 stop:389 length:144 start_codon:yes stop_codon:yes gene_type:complete
MMPGRELSVGSWERLKQVTFQGANSEDPGEVREFGKEPLDEITMVLC